MTVTATPPGMSLISVIALGNTDGQFIIRRSSEPGCGASGATTAGGGGLAQA
ncbi:MAG: hypothetical protein H0V17_10230 [Deltaproteobacteria bacterium]|nr:hypothetical protein [Deltaproteobacteria bacterium]